MTKSTLQELRELNVRKQKAASGEPEATPVAPDVAPEQPQEASHMTGNMASRMTDRPADQSTIRPVNGASGQSVRERLAASVQASPQAPAKPVLKTVTIKLDPVLDRRIEDHCYAAGRLKQDVIRDAVLLYFETIEELAGPPAGEEE